MPVRIRFPDQADHTCPRGVAVAPCNDACTVLDLGLTTFAKPFGIMLLHGLICQLRDQGERVRIVAPYVATYLWRMRVHEPFQHDPNVMFEPNIKLFKFARWVRPEDVLELTVVNVGNDDEVVAAEKGLWSIISARAPQFVPLGEQIRTALVELISNVERHSGTGRATVIAQTHRDCVRLAVGDVGIGIRHSLTHAYDLRAKADHEVLQFATELGVTATPGGGGAGLWTISDAIKEHGRAVHLGSGQGVYSVYRGHEDGRFSGLVIPGTIVEVAFDRPRP